MLNFDHTSNNITASSGNVSINGIVPGAGGGGGLTPTTTIKTSAYTAVASDLVLCNTSGGAFTVTLPLSPTNGTSVGILDTNNSFATNNLTINPNGATIEGDTSAILNINGTYLSMVYSTITTNWKFQVTPVPPSTSSTVSSGKIYFMKG